MELYKGIHGAVWYCAISLFVFVHLQHCMEVPRTPNRTISDTLDSLDNIRENLLANVARIRGEETPPSQTESSDAELKNSSSIRSGKAVGGLSKEDLIVQNSIDTSLNQVQKIFQDSDYDYEEIYDLLNDYLDELNTAIKDYNDGQTASVDDAMDEIATATEDSDSTTNSSDDASEEETTNHDVDVGEPTTNSIINNSSELFVMFQTFGDKTRDNEIEELSEKDNTIDEAESDDESDSEKEIISSMSDTNLDTTTRHEDLDDSELDSVTFSITTSTLEQFEARTDGKDDTEHTTTAAVSIEQLLLEELGLVHDNMTDAEREVLMNLFELEQLRSEKKEVEDKLDDQISELEQLLLSVDQLGQLSRPAVMGDEELNAAEQDVNQNQFGFLMKNDPLKNVTSRIDLFDGLQKSLMEILRFRSDFLNLLTEKVGAGVSIINQTSDILQDTISFGSNLLNSLGLQPGRQFPLHEFLENLEKGPSSIILVVSQFYQVVESLLSLKAEFISAFTKSPGELDITTILLQIKSISINRIIPAKLRIAMRILDESEELGRLVEEIFNCLGELVLEKTALIERLSVFLREKVAFLRNMTTGVGVLEILKSIFEGELYRIINLDPIDLKGNELLPRNVGGAIKSALQNTNLRVPGLGIDIKNALVDDQRVGQFSGSARDSRVNSLLAQKVEKTLRGTRGRILIRSGEFISNTYLPEIQLGSRCKREITLYRSSLNARVRRSSFLKSTAGISIYNRGRPTADLINFGKIYLDVSLNSGLRFSLGQRLFRQCIQKIETHLPLRLDGVGVAQLTASIVVTTVRIENKRVSMDILPGFPNPIPRLPVGEVRPHLVLGYRLYLRGKVINLNISKLKLSGCEIKLLGLNLFSYCDFIETIVRKALEERIKESLPISTTSILNQIRDMIRMRFGSEISLPLVVSGNDNLGPARRIADKSSKLVRLNLQLFQRLASFTEELETMETKTLLL